MTIKGLTNRSLSFPEIGQIRKGAPKTENGQLGKDLTYFRVLFDEKETQAAGMFKQKYGEQPQEINILLPFDEIDRCWDAWLEAYTAGRMVARSDGEKFIYLIDTKTGEILVKDGEPFKAYKQTPVGTYKDSKGVDQPIECKPVGRLKVVIPELQRLAYMTVMTTSVHDIANISAQLEALKQVNGGRLAGIPMVLRRRPKKISTPKKDGSRARYAKWMLSIEADPGWVRAKLLDFKHAALPGNGLDLLGAGEDMIDSEPIEIEQDIYDEIEEEIPSDPEMENDGFDEQPELIGKWTTEQLSALIADEEIKQHIKSTSHAVNLLNLSKILTTETAPEIVLAWVRLYKSARLDGKMTSADAAAVADQEINTK